jgi:hypothetical protein
MPSGRPEAASVRRMASHPFAERPLAVESHSLGRAGLLIIQDIDKKSNYIKSKDVADA